MILPQVINNKQANQIEISTAASTAASSPKKENWKVDKYQEEKKQDKAKVSK